jgi:hypothetical protein
MLKQIQSTTESVLLDIIHIILSCYRSEFERSVHLLFIRKNLSGNIEACYIISRYIKLPLRQRTIAQAILAIAHLCPGPAPINSLPNLPAAGRRSFPLWRNYQPKAKVLQPMCRVQNFAIQGIVRFVFKYVILRLYDFGCRTLAVHCFV